MGCTGTKSIELGFLGAKQRPDKILNILIFINFNLHNTLVANNVEVFYQEAVNQNTHGNQSHADDNLTDAWEIGTRFIHGSEYTVQAVQDNA